MDGRAWWDIVHGVTESDMAEHTGTQTHLHLTHSYTQKPFTKAKHG